jgi:hypothetical protein
MILSMMWSGVVDGSWPFDKHHKLFHYLTHLYKEDFLVNDLSNNGGDG